MIFSALHAGLSRHMLLSAACLQENPFYLSKNTASKDGSKGPEKHKSAKKK
jgi:hypothetical protein